MRVRVVHQRVEHRGHQHRRGDLLLLDRAQDLGRVEARQHVERTALDHRRHEERCARVAQRRTHQEARGLRPLPLGELHLGHRRHRAGGADDALGLARRTARVGDRDDVVRRQQSCLEGLRVEGGGGGREVSTSSTSRHGLDELVWHRADGEHLGEAGHLLQQAERALHEHRDRVDDQGRDLRVVEHVGVVVERAQRVQRRTSVALRLAGAEDEEHFRTVQGEQCGRRTASGAELLEGLDVLADPLGRLAAGQGGVAQVHDGLVGVPLERRHHQVTVVGAEPQGVRVVHAARLEHVSEMAQSEMAQSDMAQLDMAQLDVGHQEATARRSRLRAVESSAAGTSPAALPRPCGGMLP